jgi:hypothetical protein
MKVLLASPPAFSRQPRQPCHVRVSRGESTSLTFRSTELRSGVDFAFEAGKEAVTGGSGKLLTGKP